MNEQPEDTKLFQLEVKRSVTGWKERGLEFMTYCMANVPSEGGGVIMTYLIEGKGPTPHHADQDFAEHLAAFRRGLLAGEKTPTDVKEPPKLSVVTTNGEPT